MLSPDLLSLMVPLVASIAAAALIFTLLYPLVASDRASEKRLASVAEAKPDRTSGRKVAEQALQESQQRLQLMADSLPVLIAYVDAEGRYQFNNAAYEEWFGIPREEHRGQPIREIIGVAAYETIREHVEAALAGGTRLPANEGRAGPGSFRGPFLAGFPSPRLPGDAGLRLPGVGAVASEA